MDTRGWLERNTDQQILPRGNAAQRSAGMVGEKTVGRDLVPVLRALEHHAGEAGTNLDALDRVDTHHRMGDVGVDAIEDGFTQTGRHAACHHGHARANRFTFLAQRIHVLLHLRHHRRVRAKEGIVIDLVPIKIYRLQRAELGQVAAHLDAATAGQVFLGDAARGHAHCGFTRGGTPATAVIPNTVLLLVGIVGVPRAEKILDVTIILGTLVLVVNDQANRGSRGNTFEGTGKDLHRVILAPLRGMPRLAGFTPVEVVLQIFLGQRQPRRTAVDDTANGAAVAFAERGHYERFAEAVSRHQVVLC